MTLRRADVLWNPFEDIAPRVDREAREAAAAEAAQRAAREAKEARRKGAKNMSLISFGDEAEADEEAAAAPIHIASAHDVLEDPRLKKEAAVEVDLGRCVCQGLGWLHCSKYLGSEEHAFVPRACSPALCSPLITPRVREAIRAAKRQHQEEMGVPHVALDGDAEYEASHPHISALEARMRERVLARKAKDEGAAKDAVGAEDARGAADEERQGVADAPERREPDNEAPEKIGHSSESEGDGEARARPALEGTGAASARLPPPWRRRGTWPWRTRSSSPTGSAAGRSTRSASASAATGNATRCPSSRNLPSRCTLRRPGRARPMPASGPARAPAPLAPRRAAGTAAGSARTWTMRPTCPQHGGWTSTWHLAGPREARTAATTTSPACEPTSAVTCCGGRLAIGFALCFCILSLHPS